VWECSGRDITRKRRDVVDQFHVMTRQTRAGFLFRIRDNVKEMVNQDPDLDDSGRQRRRRLIDRIWEDVILVAEFKSRSALSEGRAAADYEESVNYGTEPAPFTIQSIRAWVLHHLLPFNKSVVGKVKDPVYLALSLVSLIPFVGIRLCFFFFLLLLHITGCPADTYQMINFILTFKGTQFQSGGIILLVYAFVRYCMCIKPGIPESCSTDGPGMEIPTWLHMVDLLGSGIFCWPVLLMLSGTRSHRGPCYDRDDEIDNVDDLLPLGDTSPTSALRDDKMKATGCFRTAGSRRIFKLLCLDAIGWIICVCYWVWLAFLDLSSIVSTRGFPLTEGFHGITWAMVLEYADTPQGRYHFFRARLSYNLMSAPFMFLMIPTLSMLVSLTRETGYNRNGYCVPFAWRPVQPQKRSCRVCTAT